MTRPFHVRPSWRALLLACLACIALGATGTTLAQAGDAPQEAQQRVRDPDERRDGCETVDDGDDAPHIGATTLLLTPTRLEVDPGSRIRLTLAVLGADDLRRLPVTVRFDPDVVELASTELGSAWNGRPEPVFLRDASRAGELVVGIAQLDRHQPGLFGTAEILELEFVALAAGDAGITLDRYAVIGGRPTAAAPVALDPSIVVR